MVLIKYETERYLKLLDENTAPRILKALQLLDLK